MSTKAGGSDHLFLFTYGNWLLITCAFRFNIYYLFIYWFKAMSKEAGGSDHLFLFTYGNHLLWDMVFALIFIIYYLFIQSDVNKSRWKRPPLFIYLCKSLLVRHGFHFNIQYLFIYLFIYLFKAMSTKAGVWSSCCFVYKFTPALITFLIAIQWQCFYLLMQIASCYGWITNEMYVNIKTNFLFQYFVAPQHPRGESF